MENINKFLYRDGHEYCFSQIFASNIWYTKTDSIERYHENNPNYPGLFGIKSYNGRSIYYIEGRRVMFDQIHGNFAKCTILRIDLTTYESWLVKDFGFIAFGKTIKDAYNNARLKSWQTIPIEDRIQQFVDTHPLDKVFSNKELFEWHDILTGSCMVGKYQFCRKNKIDLNKQTSVKEFLLLVKNEYKSDIIQQIINSYENSI